MFRRRSRTPPRGNTSRSGRFGKGGNWKKPWTPSYKSKSIGHNGPANNTIPELKNHYFDFHEADRFITTMKAIISYMGTQYGGDISTTLENLKDFEPPPPEDPVDKYNYKDLMDEDGKTIVKLAKDQITYSQQKEFDYEMQAYVKRKKKPSNSQRNPFGLFGTNAVNPCRTRLKTLLNGPIFLQPKIVLIWFY